MINQDTVNLEPRVSRARLSDWRGLCRKFAFWVYAYCGRRPRLRWWELGGYGGLLSLAAAMRLWDLGSRAMHHDESLHAKFSWDLYSGHGYSHLPMTHGPFQFEANAVIFFVFGDSDYTARLLYALMGVVLVGLPFFLRLRMGRLGALIASTMLCFSPAMLYFSRFARNDILMAVWSLALVICMWRYIDEGRNRYLYMGSALLALAFCTKETAYILAVILVSFLAILIVSENWTKGRRKLIIRGTSPPVALQRFLAWVWSVICQSGKITGASRPAVFLIVMGTLMLPQWSALVSLLQHFPILSSSNLVLVAPAGTSNTGAPLGGGIVIAFLIVAIMLGVSAYVGFIWNWSIWWRCALIFYGLWILFYSTFFTNMVGLGSGIWRSLGYWIVQQGESRGSQPWYYYLAITPLYEFLPLMLGVVAGFFYFKRVDLFGRFLVFWAVATFVIYTVASERMPWLLVNIALPLIILASRFLGNLIPEIRWRHLISGGGILPLLGFPLLLLLLWRLAFYEAVYGGMRDVFIPLGLMGALSGLLALGVYLARRMGVRRFLTFGSIPVLFVALVLTVRTGWVASYENGDIPVEMIVYTQTSPDVPRLLRQIQRLGGTTIQQTDIAIVIDQTSGFTWPWAWYLRDHTRVSYPTYDLDSMELVPDADVLVIHSRHRKEAEQFLKEKYTNGHRMRHRWWFPETTYREVTLSKFLSGLVDRNTWRDFTNYFLYRKGVEYRLSSEDAYVYFDKGFSQPQ